MCGIAAILLHPQERSSADWQAIEKNHPLQAGPVFGVHNGQVSNDDALFNRFGYQRQAQVDSEVIFRLLEPTSPLSENNEYLEAMIFSSRYLFLRKAFGRALITEALGHDQLMLFDALALPRLGNRPFAAIPCDPLPDVSFPH